MADPDLTDEERIKREEERLLATLQKANQKKTQGKPETKVVNTLQTNVSVDKKAPAAANPNAPIPKWKQLQMQREQEEKERLERDRKARQEALSQINQGVPAHEQHLYANPQPTSQPSPRAEPSPRAADSGVRYLSVLTVLLMHPVTVSLG